MIRRIVTGALVFDGERLLEHHAVVIAGNRIDAVIPAAEDPHPGERHDLGGGIIAPGFIDAQVNGGGGVMLNEQPTVDGMRQIALAHRRFGTTGLLPTLITDHPAATARLLKAAGAVAGKDGVLGIHLEGPHLAPARRGAHEPALMRPLDDQDVDALLAAKARIGVLLVTLAAEQAEPDRIGRLAKGGVIVSIGHSDADYATACRAIDAGARGITHLFNAMSGLGHRAPGLVGTALERGDVWCGLIADGHHVHPAAARIALRAKKPPGRLFLVTDAMAPVGSDATTFLLNGRPAFRRGGRLELTDGTLAGADIDMAASVRFAISGFGLSKEEALRMASLYPAQFLGLDGCRGRIKPGYVADLVHLDRDLNVMATFVDGLFCPS